MQAWKSIAITFATSGTLVLAGLASPALANDDDHHGGGNTVLVQDRCDPATFNKAVGPGTCVATSRHHRVTFQKFVSRLATDPARVLRESNNRGWNFDPVTMTIKNLLPGTYRYECLIHPWMRTTVTVANTVPATDDDGDDD